MSTKINAGSRVCHELELLQKINTYGFFKGEKLFHKLGRPVPGISHSALGGLDSRE